MSKKQRVVNVNSDDLVEQLDPGTRITGVGAEPVIEEPLGAGDPAVKPGTLDEKRENQVPGARRRDHGLLGE